MSSDETLRRVEVRGVPLSGKSCREECADATVRRAEHRGTHVKIEIGTAPKR